MKRFGLILGSLLLLLLLLVIICYRCCISYAEPDAKSPLTQASAYIKKQAGGLQQHVEELCRPEAPRYGDTLQQARDYIAEQLLQAGCEVELQEYRTSDGHTFSNVRAFVRGTSAERLVIGAHYDAAEGEAGEHLPGADDNASAVAVMIELARSMRIDKPELTLEFVAYASEEPPYFDTDDMGSAHHARQLEKEGATVRGMICLEMLGYFSDEAGSQPPPFPAAGLLLPSKGNFVAVVGDFSAGSRQLASLAQRCLQVRIPALRVNVPWAQESELFFSDHRNYAPRGIPSIMVTDTAMLRNPHYHEVSDTPHTLDYIRMAHTTAALIDFVRVLVYPGYSAFCPTD